MESEERLRREGGAAGTGGGAGGDGGEGAPAHGALGPQVVRTLSPDRAWLGGGGSLVPQAEPWRQGTLEHFNDTFDKRFFRTERFSGLRHLRSRMVRFERFHNAHHRYAALRGATPDEVSARVGFVPRRPPANFEIPDARPRRGQVELIRLIRSDRVLHVFGEEIVLGADVIHEYVTARVDVAGEHLDVFHLGRRIKRIGFKLRD